MNLAFRPGATYALGDTLTINGETFVWNGRRLVADDGSTAVVHGSSIIITRARPRQ